MISILSYIHQLSGSRKVGVFLTLFVAVWILSFSIAYTVIAFSINHKANNEMHLYGTSLIRKFDKLLSEGEKELDKLNQLSITDCSPNALNQIKLFNFRHYLIQSATILTPNKHNICSSMEGSREDLLQTTVSHLTSNNIRYWFKQTAMDPTSSEYYMVMEKENARISIHLQLLFDSYAIDQSYFIAQILSQSRVIATTTKGESLSLLRSREPWRSQLIVSLERPLFSVVVARNEYDIQKSVVSIFKKLFGWIALLTTMFCLLIYVLIRQHRNSFKFTLINGIKRGEFTPHFQPIINTESGICVGAEVLTRWLCRDGNIISPMFFIPIAEQYGLMPILMRNVISQTFKEIGPFLLMQPQLYISINLSLDDLEDDYIYELLEKEKKKYKLRSEQLRLELTERQFINKGGAISALHRYKRAGYRVYIDDFGTGYSSLAYLIDLPIDTLKIDKVFIDNLDYQSVTKHIVDMANTLNLELIAEGVETKEQCHILQTLGVHIVQGWLYSKAIPASEWISFCENRSEGTLLQHSNNHQLGNT